MRILILLIVTIILTTSCKTMEQKQAKRFTIGREDM